MAGPSPLTLSVNTTPTYAVGQYGLSKTHNGNSGNFVLLNFSGATPGAGDTIANSEFIAAFKASGMQPYETLYNLFNTVYTDIPAGDNAVTQVNKIALALGIQIVGQLEPAGGLWQVGATGNISAWAFACVSGQKPSAVVTSATATSGSFAIVVPNSNGF